MAGRQGQLKGMEVATGDSELDAYARAFKRSSKKRKAAQDAEIDARSVLIDAMKKKKLTLYEDRSVEPPLRVLLTPGDEKIKVEAIDDRASEDDDEGGEDVNEAPAGAQKAAKKSAPAEA